MSIKKEKLSEIKRSISLELNEPSSELNKQNNKVNRRDLFSKAKSKLINLSDTLLNQQPHSVIHNESDHKTLQLAKSMTQCSLDYFLRYSHDHQHPNHNNKVSSSGAQQMKLKKQTSLMASYPEIKVSSYCDNNNEDDEIMFSPSINRSRPATVCVDRPSVDRRSDAEVLALERPRKKLSFKEPPEIMKKSIKNAIFKNKSSEKILKNNNNKKTCDGENLFSIGKGLGSIAELGLSVVTNSYENSHPDHEISATDDDFLEKQAMRIVRTVGQAFEVCHKLSIEDPDDNYEEEEEEAIMMKTRQDLINDVNSSHQYNKIKNGDNENGCEDLGIGKESITETHTKLRDLFPNIPPVLNHNNKSSPLLMKKSDKIIAESINSDVIPALITEVGNFPSSISAQHHHEMQLLHEQLEQQRQQTQAAIAQLQLVREQLQAEQSARVDAQSRTHQLLLHNRELLDHIAALVSHLNNEGDLNSRSNEKSIPSHIAMPQTRTLPNARNSFNPVNHGGIYNCPYSSNTPSSANIDNRLETVPRFISTHHFHHQYPYEFLQPPFNNNYYSNNGTDGAHESGLMNHQCPYSTLPRYFSSFERHSEPRQIPSSSSLFHSMQDKSFNRCADNEKTIDNKNSQSACGNSCANSSSSKDYSHLIKPLSQLGTLTTRDSEGRIRVIVPSDSSSPEMKLRNGPGGISRSASEKVPNRSELLSQVERTMWARHTTK